MSRPQTRWLESLADFQSTFVFKRGKLYAALDALSRLPAYNIISTISVQQAVHEAVLQAQQNSAEEEFITFKRLATQANSGFTLTNGLVVKMVGASQCIVIPGDAGQLKQTVVSELHTSPLGGHLGFRKLLALVNTHFLWLHMPSAAQQFCRVFCVCVLCQQTKVVTQKPLGLLQNLEPPSKLFEQVTIDLITHLLVSSGFDAVFTIADIFSKYITFLPYSTTSTASDLAQLFYDNIVCKFDMPVNIVSDRDSKFLSKFWQSLMKLLQHKVALFSGYHPQTDGQSERFHWSVEQILRWYIARNQQNWVSVLQYAAFTLNSTVHAMHQQSFFHILWI